MATIVEPVRNAPCARRISASLYADKFCILILHSAPCTAGFVLHQLSEQLANATIISPTFYAGDAWKTMPQVPKDLSTRTDLVVFASTQQLLTYVPLTRLPAKSVILVDDCCYPEQLMQLKKVATQTFNYRPPFVAATKITMGKKSDLQSNLQSGGPHCIVGIDSLPNLPSGVKIVNDWTSVPMREYQHIHVFHPSWETLSNVRYAAVSVPWPRAQSGDGGEPLPCLTFYEHDMYAKFERALLYFNELVKTSSSLCAWLE